MCADKFQIKAIIRDLQPLWSILVDGERYKIPETQEDFRQLGPFPYFQIGHTWVYASDEVRETVLTFGELIRKVLGSDLFALSTVTDAVEDQVKAHFSANQRAPLTDHVAAIVNAVLAHDRRRVFLRVLHGLELVDLPEIAYGSWRILQFTDEMAQQFAKRDTGDDLWSSQVAGFLKDGFTGRTCILVESRGDRIQARKSASEISRYIINSLRYFASIHLAGVHRAHHVGLRLGETKQHGWVDTFEQTLEEHQSTFLSSDDTTRQRYPITQETLSRLRVDWDAEVLWSLAENSNPTDLERAIVTALTWFGDAQAEDDIDISYMKYWIALEALVTAHEEGSVTRRLKKGIRVLLKQATGADVSSKEIADAYSLRSQIAHGVGRLQATSRDRNRLNGWACQCIALFLRLRILGYTKRREIELQTSRIDRALSGTV